MAMFRMRQAAQLLGLSEDTLRRWADAGKVATVRDTGGRQAVEGSELARLAQDLAAATPTTSARPVNRASARNRLTGLVTKVVKDTVMAQVEIQAGPFRIVSLMSREAADDLGLAPGVLAVASVKSTNVVVEIPEG